jgi:serine/threonine protein kinase
MSISGAAWNLRPVAQVLSPTLPFHFHLSDTKMKEMVARYMGALKNAVGSLEHYYDKELAAKKLAAMKIPSIPPPLEASQIFPYRKHFTSLVDSTRQDFEYVGQPIQSHLIFFGKLSDGYNICIKFTRRYSQEVHSFCASEGFAPKLLGCEMIPGGWWMVVMDWIDESHERLCDSLRKPLVPVLDQIKTFLNRLHQNGFVHGDIRDTNIMVPKSDFHHFWLVDFDWGGTIGVVRYPMNVHRGDDLKRPTGAYDGQLILAEHDDEMLGYLFPSPPRN